MKISLFNRFTFITVSFTFSIYAVTQTALAQSTLVTIAESPTQQSSTLTSTNEFTFNELALGYNYNVNWDNVGTFDELYINSGYNGFGALDPNREGWNSQFNWVGGAWAQTTTLTLNQESSYFGLYWSAGDGNDLMNFYNGNDLVASYNTRSIMQSAGLTQDYYGDPNFGTNTIEPYAFVNFYGDENTSWDRIELTQTSYESGFEVDNLTVRTEAFDPTVDDLSQLGTVIAEVSGTETSAVDSSSSWSWALAEAAPAAPTPPIYALILFALAMLFKRPSS